MAKQITPRYIPIWARVGNSEPHKDSQFVPAPSAEIIAKQVREYDTAAICRYCGYSEMDGAMFTTVGGDICDDCC